MGCDIHTVAQCKIGSEWEDLEFEPFDWRQYGMYGFLANVRNYSDVPPLSEPRGLPDDFAVDGDGDHNGRWIGDHSFSWLTVEELLAFNYDRQIEDRRVTRQIASNWVSGAETCEAGKGKTMTWREFLGESYFKDLAKLKELGADRIVFGFDN